MLAPRTSRSLAVGAVAAALLLPAAVVSPASAAVPRSAPVSVVTSGATVAAADEEVLAKVGSTGWRVKAIQRAVGVRITGRYDSRTAAAVRRWQSEHDLPATGRTDRATYRALFPVTTTYRSGNQGIGYSLLGRPGRLRVVGDPAAAAQGLVLRRPHGKQCGRGPVLGAPP